MTFFDETYRRIPKAATDTERMPDGRIKFLPCPPEYVYVARESVRVDDRCKVQEMEAVK